MKKKVTLIFLVALLTAKVSQALDQGYTNFKSSINVVGLTKGTTIWATTALKLHDGTILTSTTQFSGGGLTLGTTNGLSLSGGSILSLGLSSGNAAGALSSATWTTFNNKLSTTSAAATYLTQSSATSTYFPITSSTTLLTTSSAAATYLPTVTAANTYLTQSSATATYQQLSSSGSFLTTSSATATYDQKTDSIAASRIAAGSLGASVIASSIAVNAVTNESIVSLSGAKITGTGSIPNAAIDGSSITKQGNTFNTGSNLLQLSGGLVPNANVDGSSVTKQGNSFNGATQLVQTNSSSLVPNANIDTSSVTKQGNTFNGASQLVQTNGSTQLPAVSGVNLTNLTASNLASGTVPNARLDSSSVTLQANTFNGNSQLVQTTAGGLLPALSAANLTSIPAGNLTGTVPNSTLDSSSVTKYGPNIPAGVISAGSLGSSVIASSIAVSGVTAGSYGSATQVTAVTFGGDGRATSASNTTISLTNSNLQSGTYSNVTVPAANVANGSLGSSVIASSIAVNAVTNPSIVSMDGSKITGTASIPNASIDGSSVTKYGTSIPASAIAAGSLGSSVIASSIAVNAVQDASIVGVSASKLTGTGTLPNATIDGSSVTKQGNTFNTASHLLQLDSSALVPNANIDGSSITKQGNTFNGASQLVQLNGSTQLPAVSGVNLTSLNATNLASGSVADARLSANVPLLNSTQTFTGINTFPGVTDQSDAASGKWAEFVSSAVTVNTNVATSGTYFDIAQITLSSGDWDVSGLCYFARAGATFTSVYLLCGYGLSSGNNGSGLATGTTATDVGYGASTNLTWSSQGVTPKTHRFNSNTTVTYYLKGYTEVFTVGNPVYRGEISARRAPH